MLTYLAWQLFLGLFVIGAKSLPDWDIDAQTNDMAPSESVLDNEIINSPTLALATTDGVSEFAQPPNGGNVVSSDKLIAQGISGCASSSERLPWKIRARDEKICPTDRLQLNGGEEKGRPAAPNGQQDGGGQNSGGSGDPKPQVMIPPKDAKLPYVFMPKGDRPKEDPELCPVAMYPVPVCGRPSDAYISTSPYPGQLTVDPCYRYVPLAGCVSVEGGRIGYCCQSAEVAYGYDDLTDDEINSWQVLLTSGGDQLKKIEQALTYGLRSLFKLVGFACIPMEPPTGQAGRTTPL